MEELASLEAMADEYQGNADASRKAEIRRKLVRLDDIAPVLSVAR